MARSSAYLSTLVDYRGNLARNTLTRLEAASGDIRDRTYGSEKLVSDVLGAWMDGVEQWWSAILGAVGPPVPTVFLRLTEGLTKVKKASVAVNVPGTAQPGWTDLVRLGGPPERRIPRENVTVAINETRDALEVSPIGLGQVHPLEGHYQGLAY